MIMMQRTKLFKSSKSLSMMKIIIFLVIIAAISGATCPITWTTANNIHMDKITTITSLASVSNGTLNYQQTFPAVVSYTYVQMTLGVIEFQSYKSTQFSFNTTISYLDFTKFNVSIQILGNSYFVLLSFQYMVRSKNVGDVNTVVHSCFLTNNLVVGTGTRSQMFDLEDYGSIDNTYYNIRSTIGGLKFWNNKQNSKTIKLQTYLKQNSSKIYQNITVTGKTSLQWICIYTFYADIHLPVYQQYLANAWFGQFNFNSSGLFNLPYYQLFQTPYGMFFGIKELTVYTSGSSLNQQLLFPSQNYTDLITNYNSQAAEGVFGYLFIYIRTCSNSAYFYSNVTYTCNDICPPGTFGQNTYHFCATCDYTCQNCTAIGPSGCSSCNSTNLRTFNNGSGGCPCNTDYVDVGVSLCKSCSILMQYCKQCTSLNVCTVCISSVLTWNSTSLKCACPVGFYFVLNNGQCIDFPGCNHAQNIAGTITCFSCDTSLNFQFLALNSTCICSIYYQLDSNSSTCVQTCGDGINLNANSSLVCDDGNSKDGDGCSSNCTIQDDYACVQIQNNSISICSLKQIFQFTYLYSQKIRGSNAANIVFLVSPPNKVLSQNDFNYAISTTLPYKKISISYDYMNSLLKISVQYTETIQLTNNQINITFDPFKVSTPTQIINLDTTGINYPLIYSQYPNLHNLIYIISIVIGTGILLASAILIFVNQKMIAIQLLLPSQLVVFGLASMNNIIQFSGLGGLKYMNGFNMVVDYSISLNNYNVSRQIMQIQYFAQFFLNFNYMGALMLFTVLGYLPFKFYTIFKQNQKKNFNKNNQFRDEDLSIGQISAQLRLANKVCNFYIDRILFTIFIFNVNQVIFCFSIQLAFANRSGIFLYNPLWSVGGSFIFLFTAVGFVVYLYQQCGKGKPTILFFAKPLQYPFHLILILFFQICILSTLIVFSCSLQIMCVLLLIPVIFRIANCPYERYSIQYFGSLYALLLPQICFILMSVTNYVDIDLFSLISSFTILGLLLLGIINSLVRYLSLKLQCCNQNFAQQRKKIRNKSQEDYNQQYQQFQTDMKDKIQQSVKDLNINRNQFDKYDKKKKIQEENSVKTPMSKLNILNEDMINPLQGQTNYMKQGQVFQQDNDDELTRLKKSLRADLKKRRGVVNNANSNWGKTGKSIKQN